MTKTTFRVLMRRLVAPSFFAICFSATSAMAETWGHYGGDAGGTRYSSAHQIDKSNVKRLKRVWTFSTGERAIYDDEPVRGSYEATPILAEGFLYVTTPFARIFALDPETGKEKWRFDAELDLSHGYSEQANRGAASWVDNHAGESDGCRHRIFYGTLDGRLISLDGKSGRLCAEFGVNGQVNLKDGVREISDDPGDYTITSPPVVAGDLVITGSAIGDNRGVELEYGTVRAFDARSGALVWAWDPLPRSPDDPGHSAWRAAQVEKTGAANAWAPLSVDLERDLLFVPTGSASPDYYGGERLGDNRYANSLVALRASTGEIVWWRQLVHHDLWDYDLASQPTLVTLNKDGRMAPAVIQATKMGLLFAFERETGRPIFKIEERPVPQSDVPGEASWPTQPFPVAPPPLVRHDPITVKDAWGLTPWDKGKCKDIIRKYRSDGIYTPPSIQGTMQIPHTAGGANWGSAAFEPKSQLAILNVSDMSIVTTLIPRAEFAEEAGSDDFPRSEFARQSGTPYGMRRETLLSSFGMPCIAPPWGYLVAVDMARGEIRWKKPFGTTAEHAPMGLQLRYGMPSVGGPIVTAGGLIFIGAALDGFIRAFDLETGKVLWRSKLPAGGQATPMTYSINGKQYVVIVAGGHAGAGTRPGDYVVAYALPE